MEKFDRAFQKFNEWLVTYVIGVLLVILMLYTTGNVIGRYAFNYPLEGMIEYGGLMVVPITFLSLANGWYIRGTFVTVNILQSKLTGKTLWWFQFVIFLWSLLCWGGILLAGSIVTTLYAIEKSELLYGSVVLQIPTLPWKLTMVVGLVLFCTRVILDMIYMIRTGKIIPFTRKAIGIAAAK